MLTILGIILFLLIAAMVGVFGFGILSTWSQFDRALEKYLEEK